MFRSFMLLIFILEVWKHHHDIWLCARINFAISEVSFGGGHLGTNDGYDLDIHASVLHERGVKF